MYHYHVEKAMDFLNENGTGAIIISKKFMNNKGGIPMKKYLLNHLQAVLSYPNETFFQDEKISTCILILKKKRNPEQPIIFLNVKSTNILSEVNILKQYIDYGKAMDTDELTLNPVPVHSLSADENWNEHFFSPKEIENIKNILFNSKQKTVGELFDLQRGKAADGDAPKITSYPFIVNEIKNDDNVRNIEKHHRVFGLSNSKLPGGEERHLILSNECLSHQMGIRVPKCKNEKDYISEYDKYLATISLSELNNFFSKIAFPYLVSVKKKRHKYLRWQARSVVSPALIIARNLRTKHSFYLNELNEEICLSSNFYGAYPKTSIMPASLIFISAYLNSAFGELSTIMSCTDQDGARKFDRTEQIGKLSFLDPSILLASEIDRVIDLFRAYSNTKDFRIFEGNTKIWRSPPSRIDLDKALSELVFKYHNPVDFDDANDLLAFVLSQCGKITNSRQR
jgi:hypothetical protein